MDELYVGFVERFGQEYKRSSYAPPLESKECRSY